MQRGGSLPATLPPGLCVCVWSLYVYCVYLGISIYLYACIVVPVKCMCGSGRCCTRVLSIWEVLEGVGPVHSRCCAVREGQTSSSYIKARVCACFSLRV